MPVGLWICIVIVAFIIGLFIGSFEKILDKTK
jgi:uncharacterized protein YneF (UPF0154 family)